MEGLNLTLIVGQHHIQYSDINVFKSVYIKPCIMEGLNLTLIVGQHV